MITALAIYLVFIWIGSFSVWNYFRYCLKQDRLVWLKIKADAKHARHMIISNQLR